VVEVPTEEVPEQVVVAQSESEVGRASVETTVELLPDRLAHSAFPEASVLEREQLQRSA
jgi:hypothetical protein